MNIKMKFLKALSRNKTMNQTVKTLKVKPKRLRIRTEMGSQIPTKTLLSKSIEHQNKRTRNTR